jgi:hypothetical protein
VPAGSGAFGRANVCYPLQPDGSRKKGRWMQKAVEYVLGYAGPNLVTDPEIETQNQAAEQAEAVTAAGQGQGFASTPAQRRAIEERAIQRAMAYFRKRYSLVENISKQKGVLDLRCGSSGSKKIHVEVKGTTTSGESVILTRHEVERVGKGGAALYVLHSIRLKGDKATGGKERVMHDWTIEKQRLKPLNFSYKVP